MFIRKCRYVCTTLHCVTSMKTATLPFTTGRISNFGPLQAGFFMNFLISFATNIPVFVVWHDAIYLSSTVGGRTAIFSDVSCLLVISLAAWRSFIEVSYHPALLSIDSSTRDGIALPRTSVKLLSDYTASHPRRRLLYRRRCVDCILRVTSAAKNCCWYCEYRGDGQLQEGQVLKGSFVYPL